MRSAGLLAAVIALGLLSACSNSQADRVSGAAQSGSPQPTGQSWTVVDADSHGAIIARGTVLRGVDRSGHVAWEHHGDWDSALCNGSCPSAMMTRAGRITSISENGTEHTLDAPRQVDRVLAVGSDWLAFVRRGSSPAFIVQRLDQKTPASVAPLPSADTLWYPTDQGGMLLAYGSRNATALRVGYHGHRPVVVDRRQISDDAACTAGGGWPATITAGPHDSPKVVALKANASDCVATKGTLVVVTTYQNPGSAMPTAQIDWISASGDITHSRRFAGFNNFYYLAASRELLVSTATGTDLLDLDSADIKTRWADAVDGLPVGTGCVLVDQRGSARWANC